MDPNFSALCKLQNLCMNPEEAILGSTRPSLSELVPFPPGQAHAPSPEPLECLLEAPVPAFLSKTFDLVEDPSLDAIISWAPTGESFVVWDPVEFARFILPHNFKHSNFSSFVRQLNTYGNQRNPVGEFGMSCRGASSIFLQGFRKMHAERWEFANEGFLRGKRHLLRIIQRRKPPGSSGLPLEAEIGKMRKERMGMMQEVMELQKEQLGTVQDLEVVNKKLQAAEEGQKQMVSFMARLLGQMKKMKEPNAIIAPPRTTMGRMKRFAKHSPKETGMGSSLLGSDKRVIFGNALGSGK
ncbi:unnamed protein product [Cuscuta campestris]|uniref:HSF-type DNA-binding domain-containing protein n=1 Tax=Cuscuta campestris TaxID=132261 RepID=A0A484LTX8_9ASTE|nr:unnamed protein product [Cuscuta campestris]